MEELISKKSMEDAVERVNFVQKFKMKWWETEATAVSEIRYIPEKILDELAGIAWDIINKK